MVATITGICAPGSPPSACRKVIRQSEIDRIVNAVRPDLPKAQRRQLAGLYIQTLAMSNEGVRQGLDRDPVIQERLRLDRLRVLADAVAERLRRTAQPSDAEIEQFYNDNRERFEELHVRAVIVPKRIDTESKPEEAKAIADKLRERAVAGEDLDKLQIDAYQQTRAAGVPPKTDLGFRGRSRLGPHQAQLAELKTGEISPVLDDNQNFYIYKIDERRPVPPTNARPEIEELLRRQRYEAKVAELLKGVKVDLNEAYFGPPEVAKQPTPSPPPKP